MATRFALADGSNTWARPVDTTPDDIGSSSSNGGTIIGAHADRVYVYGSDDRSLADGITTPTRYTIRSLDAETGKAIWTTATGDSEEATSPAATRATPSPSLRGSSPPTASEGSSTPCSPPTTARSAGSARTPIRMIRCACSAAPPERVRGLPEVRRRRHHRVAGVTRLDPTTGRARWTVQVKGEQDIVGQTDGRLILLGTGGAHRTMTLLNASSAVLATVRLSKAQPEGSTPVLLRGILYFTLPSGGVRAVAPRTGRQLWESNSTVEHSGPRPPPPPTSTWLPPNGRLAALDVRTGALKATLPGRDDGGTVDFPGISAPPGLWPRP
ncbi:PQQ-binding-like beta-propeller repeat protein [Streptomyces sp. Marseille-Q5077]|uniref:outer membrane protein assembly factor BamB family protein n=1 Tax=Streptomyces sp. Marseille-Q5077 TaxID=3418995 RepID=UPI003D03F6A5